MGRSSFLAFFLYHNPKPAESKEKSAVHTPLAKKGTNLRTPGRDRPVTIKSISDNVTLKNVGAIIVSPGSEALRIRRKQGEKATFYRRADNPPLRYFC